LNEYITRIFYLNSQILNYSDKTVVYLRLQNYNKALYFSSKTIDTIMEVLEDTINNKSYFNEASNVVDINYINQLLGGLLEAQDGLDYILLADLYEMQLNPFILNLQEIIINKESLEYDKDRFEKNLCLILKRNKRLYELIREQKSLVDILEDGYSIEYTSCGMPTLALYDKEKKYYLHSNGQVFHEAGMLAREWFSNDKSEYIIYGLGLGYHVMELIDLDETITIKVFESDLNIIQLACAFSDMEKIIASDRVELIYDPMFKYLSEETQNMGEDTSCVIHYPSIRNVQDIRTKSQLEEYFVSYSSVNNQLHKLNNNFKRNILHCDESVETIREKFAGKDIFIVAAGPSLDKNYMKLKDISKNSIILSTGTVYKKLLYAGIKPDYIIIIDANQGVYTQIEGTDESDIPLIYLSTVYHKVVENYKGKKYIVLQNGYKKAEMHATKMGYMLFETGGSVSTTALDIALQFDCKRIIFLGLDLAYSNNQDHAMDTPSVNEITSDNFRLVDDIYGQKVSTSKNLDIYRKWIEKRIKDVRDVKIIDATEGGAKISGMIIAILNDVIS
jgi:hypothetical protein